MRSHKDLPSEPSTSWRRFLIAAGTARYEHLTEDAQLRSVEQDLERIREVFTGALRYQDATPTLALNPTHHALRAALKEWFRGSDRDEGDVVVFYYSGHGDIEGDQHFLLTADSDPEDLLDTALPTEYLARRIGSSPVRLVLILLDACYAGFGSNDIQRVITGIRGLFSDENVGVFVIAAARPKEEAAQGVFVEALVDALENPSLAGERQPYIYPTSLVPAINRHLKTRALHQSATVSVTYSGIEDPPFFPNPRYSPDLPEGLDLKTQRRLGSMDPHERDLHWGPLARGVELQKDSGWYFTGRTRVLSQLVSWLEMPVEEAVPQVITGDPGVGKSAVLARLVTLADVGHRDEARLDNVPPGTLPPEGSIDVAIHGRGKTVADVVQIIGRALDYTSDDPSALAAQLNEEETPLTIVIDALDEAREPNAIARTVLRPLTTLPCVRLLIGTRTGPIRALGSHVVVKNLGEAEYQDPDEIQEYVTRRLLAEDEPELRTPYRDRPVLAREVAAVVAAKADSVFLIARLISEGLIEVEKAVDPRDREWREHLSTTVEEAFSTYLARFGSEEETVRHLLLPLAYAEGEGLPWENLWGAAASAIAGRPYTDIDVEWILENADAYVVETLDAGRSVYRLYHQALADYFRDAKRDEERQRRLAESLLAEVPDRDEHGRKAWREAHPYVIQHLSTHAMSGGLLAELVRDPLYLVAADPARLIPAIEQSRASLPDDVVRVYLQGAHLLGEGTLEERASYLEMYAEKQGASRFAELLRGVPLAKKWATRWARWKLTSVHRVLEGHTADVDAVALLEADGQAIIVSGSRDQTARIWAAETGGLLHVLEGHRSPVQAVDLGAIAGREVAITGDQSGTVRVWSPKTGEMIRELTGQRGGGVESVQIGELDGRAAIIAGGWGGTIEVWSAETGELINVLDGHADPLYSVALGDIGGRAVIASAGEDGMVRVQMAETGEVLRVLEAPGALAVLVGYVGERTVVVSGGTDRNVRIWAAETGELLHVLEGYPDWIYAVAMGNISGQTLVAAGGMGGRIQMWSAETGEALGALEGHQTAVASLVTGELGGRDVIVSAGDKTVRVWPADTREVRREREGHTGSVESLAMGRLGDRDVVVSAGDDKVWMWSAATGEMLGVLEGHTDAVISAALGEGGNRILIASGSRDRTVRVWTAETRELLHVLSGHTDGLYTVAVGEIHNRPVIVSGGRDRTVRVWSAETGKLLRTDNHPEHVRSVAIVEAAGRTVIVSGCEREVRVWSAEAGELLHTFKGGRIEGWWETSRITATAVSKVRGRALVAYVSGYEVQIRAVETGEMIHAVDEHALSLDTMVVTEMDSRIVVVFGQREIVWVRDAETGRDLMRVDVGAHVTSLATKERMITVGTFDGILMLEVTASALRS